MPASYKDNKVQGEHPRTNTNVNVVFLCKHHELHALVVVQLVDVGGHAQRTGRSPRQNSDINHSRAKPETMHKSADPNGTKLSR